MADYYKAGGFSTATFTGVSKLISGNGNDGSHNCIRVPKNAFVKRVWLQITDTMTSGGTATVSIGFSGNGESADADAFMDTTICGTAIGIKTNQDNGTTVNGAVNKNGKYFDTAGGSITATIGGTCTGGTFRVFCEYTQISV